MADFVKWGCAISEALGISQKRFLAAYDANVESHIEEAAHSSPVAEVILKFMDDRLKWEGSPSELHSKLLETAKEMGISTRQKAWPKAPNILTRRINELVPALMQLGYEVVAKRTDKTRIITINTVTAVTSSANHNNNGRASDDIHDNTKWFSKTPSAKTMGKNAENSSHDDNDDNDGLLHTSPSSLKLEELKSVYWANEFYGEHECCICGYNKRMSWQAEDFKGNKLWICDDCKLEWEKERNSVD